MCGWIGCWLWKKGAGQQGFYSLDLNSVKSEIAIYEAAEDCVRDISGKLKPGVCDRT